MNAVDRVQRDSNIMKLVRAGVDTLAIAKRHRLTHTRVNQIVERERRKKTKSRKRS